MNIFEKNAFKWSTYEANVQSYRSNLFSTQSILLAVCAFLLDRNSMILTIGISFIGLFQMWYIWFRVILTRVLIVDFYKNDLNIKYNNKGKQISDCNDPLKEKTYIKNKKIRQNINLNEGIGNNIRMTRFKLDVLIPISISIIWIIFILYSFSIKFGFNFNI